MSFRDIPGFTYDPVTNRYYRTQPTQRALSRQDLIAQHRATYLSRITNRRRFDAKNWEFTGQQSYNSSSSAMVHLGYDSHGHSPTAQHKDPVVLCTSGQIFPTDKPQEAIVVKSASPEILATGHATEILRVECSGINEEHFQVVSRLSAECPIGVVEVAYPHMFLSSVLPSGSRSSCYIHLLSADQRPADGETFAFSCDKSYGIMSIDSRVEAWRLRAEEGPEPKVSYNLVNLKGSVRALSFLAKSIERYFVATTRARIHLYDQGKLETSYELPQQRCAKKLWSDGPGQALYAQTFHGQVYMFDVRYAREHSCLLDLSGLGGGGGIDDGIKCEMNEGRQLHVALDENLLSFDLRKLGKPHTCWSIPGRTIKSLYVATDVDGLDCPHISIEP